MPRALDEWVGKTEDTPVPARVKDRILKRQEDAAGVIHCARCGQPIDEVKNKPIFDHVVALVLAVAGQRLNRETNIEAIGARCCNPQKTAVDIAVKSKVAASRKKRYGLEKKRSSFPTAKNGKWKAKIGGGVVPRED